MGLRRWTGNGRMNGFRRAQLTITAVTNAAVIDGLVVIAQLQEWKENELLSHKHQVFSPFFLLIHHCPNMGVRIGLAQFSII